MSNRSKLYSVSEIAREFSVTPRTIRFYEDKGLLNPRRVGDRRVYDYRDIGRLKLILRLKKLGFSLSDAAEYISLYKVDDLHVTQLKIGLDKINNRIATIESQLEELSHQHKELKKLKQEALDMLAGANQSE